MMMKKLLFSSLFLLGSLVSQAQHEYTIEGKVEGVKDGTLGGTCKNLCLAKYL